MLMRCARAYNSSCSQVVLIYLDSTAISSQFTLLQLIVVRKITKNPYCGR